MRYLNSFFIALVLMGSIGQSGFTDSFVFKAPGVNVQQKRGWFGRESVTYQDALGNKVERSSGLFGLKNNRTKIFGTEAVVTPRQTSVINAQGTPLIRSRNTWFHGKETEVDGSAILNSLGGLLNP